MRDAEYPYYFCTKRYSDANLDNTGENLVTPISKSVDFDLGTASVDWSRPYDMSSDTLMSLEGEESLVAFLSWSI